MEVIEEDDMALEVIEEDDMALEPFGPPSLKVVVNIHPRRKRPQKRSKGYWMMDFYVPYEDVNNLPPVSLLNEFITRHLDLPAENQILFDEQQMLMPPEFSLSDFHIYDGCKVSFYMIGLWPRRPLQVGAAPPVEEPGVDPAAGEPAAAEVVAPAAGEPAVADLVVLAAGDPAVADLVAPAEEPVVAEAEPPVAEEQVMAEAARRQYLLDRFLSKLQSCKVCAHYWEYYSE